MDHNATTPVLPDVLEAMLPYFREYFGNASSVHSFGRDARNGMEEARERLANFIGAQSQAEALNQIISLLKAPLMTISKKASIS
jgi:cysteine sulfinate desulfinase/cysteine desulfurase-like protein